MEIKQETLNGIEIFSVKGRLDSTTSTTFENLISTNLSQGKKQILFDLEELDYISSAGLRVILKTMKDLQRADGRMVLCSLQEYVKEVFEIAGFDSYLNIEATKDAALSAF